MKILYYLILTALLLSYGNSESYAMPLSNTNPDGKLIQSYVVNDKWECFYSYNNDNTLKKIVFKTEGVIEFTKSFKYKNGKIVESLKKKSDGSITVKKQFEYKDNLIVKKIVYTNGELTETQLFKYNNDFLEKITIKENDGGKEYIKITSIEKLAGENKIKVKRKDVATHIVTYGDRLTPESAIPGYKPIVQINNNGLTGNILLKEVYVGDNCSTTIEKELEFDNDGKTVLSSKITYKHRNNVNHQEIKYNY